jgi:hypothetical protein
MDAHSGLLACVFVCWHCSRALRPLPISVLTSWLWRSDLFGGLKLIHPAGRCRGMDRSTLKDKNAAELRRAKGKAKKKPKPSESSKEQDALIAELDKGPLDA